jgi:Tfp pilus assembly protein PilV
MEVLGTEWPEAVRRSGLGNGFVMRQVLKSAGKERGISLIEMMIALLVVTVGLIGSVALATLAIGNNTRSRAGSTSAALAEMVIDQISAIPVGAGVTSVTVTDCAGNSITMNTSGATSGSGANLTASGNIDFTQSYSSVPAGYAMRYTVCGATTATRSVYDVRWNVQSLPSGRAQYVVVGAQLSGSGSGNLRLNALPLSVRTVVGNAGN